MEWAMSATRLAAIPLTAMIMITIRRFLQNCGERKGRPLPPGPTPLPLIGNVLSVNSHQLWLTFTEWREKYGDLIYLRLFDVDVIVINSPSVAFDLLERRSKIYSDRPFIAVPMASYDFHFAFSRYGEHWRACRRLFQQTFRSISAPRFLPMQLHMARQLMMNMIDSPNEYPSHILLFSAGVALSAVYDYEPRPRNDTMISILNNYVRIATPELAPWKIFVVKAFPFLLHVPDWFPGSWIKQDTQEAYAWRNKLVETPYRYAQERMKFTGKDNMNVSLVSDHIPHVEGANGSPHSKCELALKHTSASAVVAATDTTSSTLMVFVLAMVQNPRVWKRAQVEIDSVVGTDRLPEFEDRPSLPYVDAIIREVLRWRPVLPIGAPHAVMQSDIYDGHYIPKGAYVIVNAWAMSRDEARYPNADQFMPERFLTVDGTLTDDDPGQFIFGFGRRRCPGRHFADASVWIVVATMLSSLDFNLAKDEEGNRIEFEATFTTGAVEHPDPFPCRLTPRAHVSKGILDCVLHQ